MLRICIPEINILEHVRNPTLERELMHGFIYGVVVAAVSVQVVAAAVAHL